MKPSIKQLLSASPKNGAPALHHTITAADGNIEMMDITPQFATELLRDEKFYLASEVEKMLSVSKSTLKRWIKAKKIVAVKFGEDVEGNPWKISESALAEFKAKHSRYNTDGNEK